MLTLQFHGSLGRAVGEHWCLDVRSVGEAIHAIESMTKKLYTHLYAMDKQGVEYRVIFGDRDHECIEELTGPVDNREPVHIVPVVVGAGGGKGGVWQTVIGAVLIVVGAILTIYGGAGTAVVKVGVSLITLGASLTLGGLVQLLSPQPKLDVGTADQVSSTFSGVRNTSVQGIPVPVCYGQLIVGSQTISVGLENVDAKVRRT